MKILESKNIVFIIYSVGVILDHLTTNIGVNVFGLKETNILTFFLIENGLWVYVDILLFISVISIISLLWDRLTTRSNNFILVFPLLSGFVRMIVGMWNMVILLNI